MDPNQTSPNDPNMPSGLATPTTPDPNAQPQQPAPFATPTPTPEPASSGLSQANWNVPNPGSGTEPALAPTQPNPAPSWDSLGASTTSQPQSATPQNSWPGVPNPAPAPSFSETVQTPVTPAPEPAQPQSGLPSWAATDTSPNNPAPAHVEPLEPAPTDLSQLSSMGTDSTVYTPPVSSPETLVVPPTNPIPENSTPETHRKLPKGLIIVGAIILLLVVAASAYFILGIGKNSGTPQASSLPAQQQLPLTEPPQPVTQPVATGSGTSSFGNLGGSSASASPTTPSALDLLRQRQATTSATP